MEDDYYDGIRKLYSSYDNVSKLDSSTAPPTVGDDSFFEDMRRIYSAADTADPKPEEKPVAPVAPVPPVPHRSFLATGNDKPRKSPPVIGREKERFTREVCVDSEDNLSLSEDIVPRGRPAINFADKRCPLTRSLPDTSSLSDSPRPSSAPFLLGSAVSPRSTRRPQHGALGEYRFQRNRETLNETKSEGTKAISETGSDSSLTNTSVIASSTPSTSLIAVTHAASTSTIITTTPPSPVASTEDTTVESKTEYSTDTSGEPIQQTSETLADTSAEPNQPQTTWIKITKQPSPTSTPQTRNISQSISSSMLASSGSKRKPLPPTPGSGSTKRATIPDDVAPQVPRRHAFELPSFYPNLSQDEIPPLPSIPVAAPLEESDQSEKSDRRAKLLGVSVDNINAGKIMALRDSDFSRHQDSKRLKQEKPKKMLVSQSIIEENESAVQRFIREKQPHVDFPSISILMMPEDQFIRVEGPSPHTYLWSPLYGTDIYGESISNYPFTSSMKKDGRVVIDKTSHQGDPICDQFCVDRYCNRIIFAVADGCNWGIKPKTAAYNASRSFIEHVRSRQNSLTLVNTAAGIFLEGFHVAQQTIMAAGKDPRFSDLGTTTMIAGGIVELPQNQWGFIAAGVGDCKAFYFSVDGKMLKILEGDSVLKYKAMKENDFVLVCSDGVHDNLDPQTLGMDPKDFGLNENKTWDELCDEEPDLVGAKKTEFAYNKLLYFYKKAKKKGMEIRMQDLTDLIVQFCKDSTKESRAFMENNPNSPLPEDYKLYPGKLDHVTCLCIRAKRFKIKTPQVYAQYVMSFGARVGGHSFVGSKLIEWLMKEILMSKEVAEYTAQGLLGFRYIIACSPPTKRGVTPVTTFDGSFNELAYYEVHELFRVTTKQNGLNLSSLFDRG